MRAGVFGAALLIVSTGALAAAPQGESAPQDEAAEDAARAEKKICRTDKSTGSLTRRTRICLTRAEWSELHRRTRRGLDDFVGGAGGGCRAPSNDRPGTMCGG